MCCYIFNLTHRTNMLACLKWYFIPLHFFSSFIHHIDFQVKVCNLGNHGWKSIANTRHALQYQTRYLPVFLNPHTAFERFSCTFVNILNFSTKDFSLGLQEIYFFLCKKTLFVEKCERKTC